MVNAFVFFANPIMYMLRVLFYHINTAVCRTTIYYYVFIQFWGLGNNTLDGFFKSVLIIEIYCYNGYSHDYLEI